MPYKVSFEGDLIYISSDLAGACVYIDEENPSVAILDSIIVEEVARRMGLGTEILQLSMEIANGLGATSLRGMVVSEEGRMLVAKSGAEFTENEGVLEMAIDITRQDI